MNYKLVTQKGRQDNFRSEDVTKVVLTRIADRKTGTPFARVSLVAVPGDPGGHNGLYIYPGMGQGVYRKNGTGNDQSIRVLSEKELNDHLKLPNGRAEVQKAFTKAVSNLDRSQMQEDMATKTRHEMAKNAMHLNEIMTTEGKQNPAARDKTGAVVGANLTGPNLASIIKGTAHGELKIACAEPTTRSRIEQALNEPGTP